MLSVSESYIYAVYVLSRVGNEEAYLFESRLAAREKKYRERDVRVDKIFRVGSAGQGATTSIGYKLMRG